MTFCDDYNKWALEIADSFQDKIKGEMVRRIPQQLTQDCNPNKSVLVVGMNPSFNAEWIAKDIGKDEDEVHSLFSLNTNDRDNRLEEIRDFEKGAFKNHPYFKRVRDLSIECGFEDNWNHLDLFIMRETSQKEALKSVGYKEFKEDESKKINDLNEYGECQRKLFEYALCELNPKIIIVANTAAAIIVSHYYNKDEMNSSFVLNGNIKNTPRVFLSGMLGGQRALDRFSRLRLIKEVKEHL